MRAPADADLARARAALPDGGVVRTPLVALDGVRAKLECHQRTGSFKLRGATAAAAAAPDGVLVTASAGNHGLGLAEALRRLRRPGRVFVPAGANQRKIDALRGYEPEVAVEPVAGSYDDTERAARAWAAEHSATFVSSYNDPHVIAGQATVGTEILEELPEVEAIVAPVGGGGLLSGICTAIGRRPVAAFGVEPEASAAMAKALAAGRIDPLPDGTTSIAEGLVGNLDADAVTFAILRDHRATVTTASEEEIRAATAELYRDHGLVVEPSAAAAWCGVRTARAAGHTRIAVVLTGGNIDFDSHRRLIDGGHTTQ